MRARTVKRLAILIAVIVLTGGSAYAVWRFQVEKMAQGVVAQADKAVEEKNYAEAAELSQQHLLVVSDDLAVQLKYADVLLKLPRTAKHQETALGIYNEILRQEPGREEVRRRAAEAALELGGFETARGHLANLLRSAKEDGHLEFMMGQCYEADKDAANAAKFYQHAIEHGSPDQVDASERLATLIRENEKLGKPEDADKVIDDMVKADSGNYRAYLVRGHYRHLFKLDGAVGDFQKSLELAPDQPDIYLEMAQLAERSTVLDEARRILDQHRPFTFLLPTATDEARQILDNGLAAVPSSVVLSRARAYIERKAGRVDRWIEFLEAGVRAAPEHIGLRLELAGDLAALGDTGKLLLHIEELKGLGLHKLLTDYFTAYYYFNNKEFERAKQILTSIQTGVVQSPDWKARVNVLLAQCYSRLHEPEKEWEADQRAFNAKPEDTIAQTRWINGRISRLVSRGENDEAIKEYQRLLERSPRFDRKPLVNLLLVRNRQRPPAQRNWGEVEVQLDEMAKAAPNSVDPIVLRAICYAEQDQQAKARETLEAARSRFPEALELWTAEAELLVRQKKFDEALDRLDGAQKKFGDRIELRLARATIWAVRGAKQEEVVTVLNGLAKDLEPFPKEKRRGLLVRLAAELAVQQDVKSAEELWLRLAEEDPEDVNPHLQLLELAFNAAIKAEAVIKAGANKLAPQAATKAEIDKQIKAMAEIEAQIKAIERIDPTNGRFCRAKYLTWQASRSKDEAEGEGLRTEARALLTELKTRRDEWDQIPLTEASLVEQELSQKELGEAPKREKQESLITLYLRAIELGSRDPNVVRKCVAFLLANGRSNEAIQLFSRMPAATQFGGDLGQVVAQAAIAQNNLQAEAVIRKAEEIARKAVAAKPGNLKERLWLVQILVYGKHTAEAETELRQAVALAEGDPEPWRALVFFLIDSKQLPKAEQALRDAEKKLPEAPLALAECCERIGRANEGPNTAAEAKKWYQEARQWFGKALAARKEPKDQTVTRRLFVEFLLRTDPGEAEKQLNEILGQEAGAKDAGSLAWARRCLSVMYITGKPQRPDLALALFDPARVQGAGTDPEDRRVRANVLVAQGTPKYRLQAIGILESLVNEKPVNPQDLHLLAQLEEAEGDWPKSRDQYRRLIERATNLGDVESRRREAVYIAEFAEKLLQSHQPREDHDLAEAQELIEKLKRLQPDLMASVALEVALNVARNNLEAAAALIRSNVERPNLNPATLPQLALMAEKIGQVDQFKLAEEIYQKNASLTGATFGPNTVHLIHFLVRRERLPEVLELCESLRKNAADRVKVDGTCLDIFANPSINAPPEQIKRVIDWFDEERRNGQLAMIYRIGLGNLYERMGQDRKAEEHYRAVINSNDQDGIASNNLAWLMALNGGKWNDALDLINRAIKIKGAIPDYLDTRAVVYLSAGEGLRAIEDLKAAINGQPTAPKYFHLAQAYLSVNDKANAKKNLEVAKTKGLPKGLHRLEMTKYQKVLDELGQ